jgi:hypothetical protein
MSLAPSTTYPPSALLKTGAIGPFSASDPSYNQPTIAVAQFGRHLVTRPGRLVGIYYNIGNCGSAGSTVFRFRRIPSGSSTPANLGAADITIDNAAVDGSTGVAPPNASPGYLDVNPGDIIECNVTTAPTGGANLCWSPMIYETKTL